MSLGPRAVPAVPNASKVRGKLLKAERDPDGGWLWHVAMDDSQDVPGLPNFTRSYIGRVIDIYSRLSPSVIPHDGSRVEAKVSYRGDERGGLFLLSGDELRNL